MNMREYDHKKIEAKRQKRWAKKKIYKTEENSKLPKCYVLDMFPYPSGEGLHVGHPKGYIATDIYSRFKKMNGYNVLHPMGWDAFGLPAENYAIKNKTHPRKTVEKNVERYKKQLSIIGFNYDWSREINTTDPSYYKWTQWIFLKLLEKGLAYQSFEPINWCPSCQTGLANEDLEDGKCERCGTIVEKKPMRQWALKITNYADRLLSDLPGLNWPESIKESQRNWIGKSEGAEIDFEIKNSDEKNGKTGFITKPDGKNEPNEKITVFTTRADTLFGVTYLVLSPEHPLIQKNQAKISNFNEIADYIQKNKAKSEIERTAESKEKTGIELKGLIAVNPASKEEIPIWVADYVLASYGTGAVMAVPAHDQQDFAFANKFGLPIKQVVASLFAEIVAHFKEGPHAFIGTGKIVNSGEFNGHDSQEAKTAIVSSVGGRMVTRYKLRDWVFSRQRYWGEPIPVVHCEKCGVVPVSEKDLPVELPDVKNYAPTGTGESPLATIDKWVNVPCPKCRSHARRETNTMPQWAGSCWYYLRYMDPKNKNRLVDPEKEKYWAPVDVYVGGAEHAARHLIYARFWHKFLGDINLVSTSEPFIRFHSVGLIMGEDGQKMSKRFGNVVNPDKIVEIYGADTFRIYEMFIGPFEQASSWDTRGIMGSRRFVERIWRIGRKVGGEKSAVKSQKNDGNQKISADFERILHTTIAKVSADIESFNFNTAISGLMILSKEFENLPTVLREDFSILLRMLAPFAPHVADELWLALGNKESIHLSEWPKFDPNKIAATMVKIIIQVDGKVRGELETGTNSTDAEVKNKAVLLESVKKWLNTGEIKRTVYVKNRLINFVTR